MADDTPRLSLSTFDQGDATWDHTDTVETLDELAIDRGPISDRPSSGDYDDQLYFAVDQRILWRWDDSSSDWNAAAGLGSDSQRVPETTFLESIDVNTLADGSLEEQIDTAQLSNEAVTAAKIAAAAVKSDAIANDAVNSDAIASDQVTVDELAEALGTDSDNKIPGTTYFKKSSHEALEAESLGITNAGSILQIGQGIPAGGFSIELGAADDVTSTEFAEVAKAYGTMHNRDKPEGMVLYGRAFVRATVSDGEEMTVRPVGGGEGSVRVFEDLEITVDTDSFSNYDTGWVNVDQDNRLISARKFEAKVTGGTGSFSGSAGNQLQCHFEWRVE